MCGGSDDMHESGACHKLARDPGDAEGALSDSDLEPWSSSFFELRDALERVRLELLHREAVLHHASATSGLGVGEALPLVFLHENAEPHRVARAPSIEEALGALEQHLALRATRTDPSVARFGSLVRELGLDEIERRLLLTAIAPQFSTGFAHAFDRLVPGHDRGRIPLPSLADLVAVGDPERLLALTALRPDARLRVGGLLVAEGPSALGLARTDAQTTLACSPVVLDYLLGVDTSPRPFALQGVARRVVCDRELDALPLATAERTALTRLAGHEGRDDLGRLRVGALASSGHAARGLAEAIAGSAERDLLVLEGLVEGSSQAALHAYRQVALYARLHDLVLFLDLTGASSRETGPELVSSEALAFFLEAVAESPQVLVASRSPLRALERVPELALMSVVMPPPGALERAHVWAEVLPAADAEALGRSLQLDLDEIASLARRARSKEEALRLGRQVLATPLEGLAERLEGRVSLEELVVPAEVRARLDEIVTFVVHGHRVDERLGESRSRGRRLTALIHGPAGTGKTAAATAIALAIGRPIYRVDVGVAVDRYIPDIERRFERLFERAAADQAVLLFDDVDTLFGKRSDNAQDRFANVQVNLLVSRMEAHPGLSIATVSAIETVDPAFRRKAQFVVQLPKPGVEARQRLWRQALGEAGAEVGDELVSELAASLDLSGGAIRRAVLTAVILASSQGSARLDEAALREAARRESRSAAGPAPAPRAFGL